RNPVDSLYLGVPADLELGGKFLNPAPEVWLQRRLERLAQESHLCSRYHTNGGRQTSVDRKFLKQSEAHRVNRAHVCEWKPLSGFVLSFLYQRMSDARGELGGSLARVSHRNEAVEFRILAERARDLGREARCLAASSARANERNTPGGLGWRAHGNVSQARPHSAPYKQSTHASP